jgi:hypothetical protein
VTTWVVTTPFLVLGALVVVLAVGLDVWLFDAVVTGGTEVTGGGVLVFVPRAAAGASGIARQMPAINVPDSLRTGCPFITEPF